MKEQTFRLKNNKSEHKGDPPNGVVDWTVPDTLPRDGKPGGDCISIATFVFWRYSKGSQRKRGGQFEQQDLDFLLGYLMAHEIGHQIGLDHREPGTGVPYNLMQSGWENIRINGSDFAPADVRAIRQMLEPNKPLT